MPETIRNTLDNYSYFLKAGIQSRIEKINQLNAEVSGLKTALYQFDRVQGTVNNIADDLIEKARDFDDAAREFAQPQPQLQGEAFPLVDPGPPDDFI